MPDLPSKRYVLTPTLTVYRDSLDSGEVETELLRGEVFEVEYDGEEYGSRFAYGFAPACGYHGYVNADRLLHEDPGLTHRVASRVGTMWKEPNARARPIEYLGMNARVRITDGSNGFVRVGVGWMHSRDLIPLEQYATDHTAEAEKFLGAPYVWGGRCGQRGLDCSAVALNALGACGVVVSHNAKRIMDAAGIAVPLIGGKYTDRKRGDFVFFDGHMGIMLDERVLLHASGHHMKVVAEPLNGVIWRKQREEKKELIGVRRFSLNQRRGS